MSNYRDDEVERLADAFRVLSNPNRLRIFLRLVSSRDSTSRAGTGAGTLGRNLGITASTVSHHLKELRMARLIRMERRGKRVNCEVERKTLYELSDLFAKRFFAGQRDRR